jgi:RNA polymerase sigma-70 factor (ECF subfamily)
LLAGDERAFQALVKRHHAQLVRLARLFVRDEETAREVAQDAWLAVLAGLPRFQRRSSLKTWVFRILVNIAKTRGARELRGVALLEHDERRSDERGPEQAMIDRETLEILARALRSLPEAQAAVVLSDIDGLDATEISYVLGVSESNLRVLRHRARLKLREALQRYAA